MDSIYKTPDAAIARAAEADETPDFQLYKISAVGVATFFGTILAGGYIASRNLKRLGRDEQASKVLRWSGAALLAILVASFFLPGNGLGLAFTVAQIVVMVQLAKSWFQDDLDAHVDRGGALASNWRAFGISLLFSLGILVVLLPLSLLMIGLGVPL